MKTIRTSVRWALSIGAALLASNATAGIPSAASACVSDLVETTPSSDFTALEGGSVVRHEPTGLEWRRCAEGMSWTGTSCTDRPIYQSWQGALQYANTVSGWRLPNVKELHSIVENCRIAPAINQQVFPGTPSSKFWSASPYAGTSGAAWPVNFQRGSGVFSAATFAIRNPIRLVRGGE